MYTFTTHTCSNGNTNLTLALDGRTVEFFTVAGNHQMFTRNWNNAAILAYLVAELGK